VTPWLIIFVAVAMTAVGVALGMGAEYLIDYREGSDAKGDGRAHETLADRMDGGTE
jgi:hypothetical protein